MLKAIWTWIEEGERKFRRSWGMDISTPWARFWGHVHYNLFDHAFLRLLWTNFYEIAPGVYRSNHPNPARLRKYKAMGIKSVLSLRGEEKFAHWLLEKEACEELGLELHTAKMWARNATKGENILKVLDEIRRMEKPLMFHCKSGADRAGIVAAMYLMVFEDVPVEKAREMMGIKYLHLKFTKTGVQDYILDVYEARKNAEPIGFEDWLRREYRAQRLNDAWDEGKSPADSAQMLRDLARETALSGA